MRLSSAVRARDEAAEGNGAVRTDAPSLAFQTRNVLSAEAETS